MKSYLIDHEDEDKRLNFQNTIDVYDLDKELEYFPIRQEDLILDAGCGNGNVIEKLIQKGISKIHALDLSEDRVRQAKERFKNHLNLQILQRPLEQTELRDSSYDLIISRYIFEHVLKPAEVMSELGRILKPDGILCIINFDDIFFNFHTKNAAFNEQLKIIESKIPQDLKIGRKLPHLLKKSGFESVEWEAKTYFFQGKRLEMERENSRMRLEQGRKNLSQFFNNMDEYDTFAENYLEEMKDDCNVLSMTKYLIKAKKGL